MKADNEVIRLDPLVGKSTTRGQTKETSQQPALRIDATDTYSWLAGKYALLHEVDALVGEQKVEGVEIIGYDPEAGCYITQYFGSDGPNRYRACLTEEVSNLVWKMESKRDRFTGTFSEDRQTITGHWEQLDDNDTWHPWMDVTLTK